MLYFETANLTEPGTHYFSWTGLPVSLTELSVSPDPDRYQCFHLGSAGTITVSHALQTFYLLNVLSNPPAYFYNNRKFKLFLNLST